MFRSAPHPRIPLTPNQRFWREAPAVLAETVPNIVPAPVAPVPEPEPTVSVPSVTVQPRVPVGVAASASNGASPALDDIPF